MMMEDEKLQIAAERLRGAGVSCVTPANEAYEDRRKIFSSRPDVQFKPALLVCPRTVEEVSTAVKVGAALGYSVVARSGGHSSRGLSLGGKDGAMAIDMRAFDRLDVDVQRKEAVIGPANRLGPVYLALDKHGFSISAGSCPAVGFGGLCSHGGIHTSHRLHAMTSDAVIAFEAVLADGSIVRVTEKEQPDLFWALKGNASSFAIVTNFFVCIWKPPPRNVRFDLVYHTSVQVASRAWQAFQQWAHAEDAVREFGNFSFVVTRCKKALPCARLRLLAETKESPRAGHIEWIIFGNFLGEEANFLKHFESIRKQMPEAVVSNIRPNLPWIDVLHAAKVAVPEHTGLDLKGYDEHWPWHEWGPITFFRGMIEMCHRKSLILTEDLSGEAIDEVLRYAADHRLEDLSATYLSGTFIGVSLSGGYDSAINGVSTSISSIPRRNMQWDIWLAVIGPSEEGSNDVLPHHRAFVDDIFLIFRRHLSGSDWGSYRNYADVNLPDWQERYYGSNWERLQVIKRRYDPSNVFSAPLGVDPRRQSKV